MTYRCACIAAMALVATPASAQQLAVPAGLNIKALSTVFVEDDRGAETRGKLVRLEEQSILLLVNGQERRFSLDRIVKIERRGDSLRDGFIIGAVLGAALGVLTSGLADCRANNGRYEQCGAGVRIGFGLVSAGFYGAVGAGIDAAIPGRTTLYRKPVTVSAASPNPDGRGAALGFSLRW